MFQNFYSSGRAILETPEFKQHLGPRLSAVGSNLAAVPLERVSVSVLLLWRHCCCLRRVDSVNLGSLTGGYKA